MAFATHAATYAYDVLGRVTSVTDDNGLTTAYIYDAGGNRSIVSTANTPATGAIALIVGRNSAATAVPLVVNGAYTSVGVATAPANGTATASGTSITYKPASGYTGADSFTYTANHGSATSAPATVSVAVSPTAMAVSGFAVPYGSINNSVPISVLGAFTSVGIAVLPTNGRAKPSGMTISYTPTTGYSGSDSFTYTASDAVATSAPANVAITVGPPPPVANPVSATVPANTTNNPIPLNITGGPPASVAVSTSASHGAASASGTAIAYSPTGGYSGSDSFAYTASNASGTSRPATVSITVQPMTAVVPNPANCCATGSAISYTFAQTSVSVTGGSGSYTYKWNVTSDAYGVWSGNNTTLQTITPSVTGVAAGNASGGGYSCTVTDTNTHIQATSNTVGYQYTRTGGGQVPAR